MRRYWLIDAVNILYFSRFIQGVNRSREILYTMTINLNVLIPILFKARSSEFEDNLPYVNRVDNKTDIGNDRTKNQSATCSS